MKLITQQLRQQLPPLGAQDGLGGEALAYCKFFTPDSSWTWYVTEYDGDDLLFGLVDGLDRELGYFSLSELQRARGRLGLRVERDSCWEPRALEEIAPEFFAGRKRG